MEKKQAQGTYGFLFQQAGPKKKSYIESVIFAVLSVVFELIPYYFVIAMIKNLLSGEQDLWVYGKYCLLMAVFYILKILFHCISTTLSHGATFEVLATLRKSCTDKLGKMPLGEVNARSVGGLKSTIMERIDSIETTLAHVVPEFTSNLIPPIVIFITIFAMDWRMGFASLITLVVGMICMTLMMIGYEKFFTKVVDNTKRLNDTSVEYINGIEVIKVFGKAESSYQKFVEAAHDCAYSYVNWMQHSNIFFTAGFVIMPATMVSILPIGAILYGKQMIGLPEMVSIIILSVALIEPIIRLASFKDDMAQIDIIVGEVQDILNAPELERPQTLQAEIKDASITLEDVHFAYQEKEVLHGIDLSIGSGEYIALVGPSGSGKSTIAKLIASMWDVKSGRIRVGGVDIRDIPLDTYMDMVAYVSQSSYLFNDTVMNNMKIGSTGRPISDEEVIEVCKKAGVHDFILSLENGYDTVVGSGGGHLSGGEKQRLSIARAMLKDAPIVILDEATAYSDPENEALIQESVSKLVENKTLIVIAHRLSTVNNADRIVLVNDGRIEAVGKHAELLEKSPLYQHMWESHISVKDQKEAPQNA